MVSALLPGSLQELSQSPAAAGPDPPGGMEVPARPRKGSVTRVRPDNSGSTGLGGLENQPCVHPSGSVLPWDWTGPAGGKRTRPGMAAELLGSCRIDALPSPPSSFPPGLRLPSLPFSLPSRSKQNGCSMAILFPVWKGEAGTLGLGSFLEAAAMSEPNSPVSTWHQL